MEGKKENMAYKRAMRKRYPPRVYNTREEAEQYQGLARDSGTMNYDITEEYGQFYVRDTAKKGHPYWRKR